MKKSSISFNPGIGLLLGVFAVSTGAVFVRAAEAPALVVAAYRLGIVTIILAPIAWFKAKNEFKNFSSRDLKFTLLAGLFLALHFAAWISSLDYTSISSSVLLVTTNPIWVGLLSPVITRDKIRIPTIIGIAMSVTGSAVIGAADFTAGGTALWGDYLALAGSVFIAFYLMIGRNLRRKYSLLPYITLCYGSAAVILWIIVLALNMQISGFSGITWISLGCLAVIPQLIGHTIYNWALRWFSPGYIAVSLLGEPIIASILAWIIFNESLTGLKVIGGSIILFAIYVSVSGEKHAEKRVERS